MKRLFTERHGGAKPRVMEALDDVTRTALAAVVWDKIEAEWFGMSYPARCPDGYTYAGTDRFRLRDMMNAYGVIWPQDLIPVPTDGQVFDLLEFSYEVIAEPEAFTFHGYFGHSHYNYDQDEGRQKFAFEVNRLLERNGMAFELKDGEVTRIAPAMLQEALAAAVFNTGDAILDGLLETARHRILNRSLTERGEALEKLWDAWERLKTVEAGKDKQATARALLDKAATEPLFRAVLEEEAKALTVMGNKFMIRHTETDKVPVTSSAQIDYLFHRMFSLIRLLLKASGRGQ